METVLNNFMDLSWWVTGLFPGLVIWLFPRFVRKLIAVFGRVKVSRLKTVKSIRRDDLKISYEMQKASVFYAVFVLVGVLWSIAVISVPVQKTSTLLVSLSAFPVLIAEFSWLLKDSFVREILKARDRLRHPKEMRRA